MHDRFSFMLLSAASFLAAPNAIAQSITDTKYVGCVVISSGSQLIEKSSIAKVTGPGKNSRALQTAIDTFAISSEYRNYLISKGRDSFYKEGCFAGETAIQADSMRKTFIADYANATSKTTTTSYQSFWPEFLTFMANNWFYREERSLFAATPAGG